MSAIRLRFHPFEASAEPFRKTDKATYDLSFCKEEEKK
jgi:hypothetical protein